MIPLTNMWKCCRHVRNSILFLFFYFDDLHLEIIESISLKASEENSSAQWAIFAYIIMPLIVSTKCIVPN